MSADYMKSKEQLTNCHNIGYNNNEPVKCDCGRMVAVIRDGNIYVKCRRCKREIKVRVQNS